MCFVFVGLGGPGGGFDGFQVGSKSSGKPLLRLPRRPSLGPPKPPPGPPRKNWKSSRLVQNAVDNMFYVLLCFVIELIKLVKLL